MGKTLFWYLFKDLVGVFVIAAVVLAGIMSFAGLLKWLTQFGLDGAQVAQLWMCLMPAMMTYSVPVAAVFATSIIYGRFTADNELTAARAAGLSYSAIIAPAVALGLVAAVGSLLFLSYVVPYFSYQAERVVFHNVAKVIASQIDSKHSLPLDKSAKSTVYAQKALIAPGGDDGERQSLVLIQPMLVRQADGPDGLRVPTEISMARTATLHLDRSESSETEVRVELDSATSFSRKIGEKPQMGVGSTEFGPFRVPSQLKPNVKFMDIGRLKDLADKPETLERVRRWMVKYIDQERRQTVLDRIAKSLADHPAQGYTIEDVEPCQIIARRAKVNIVKDRLLIEAADTPIQVIQRRINGSAIYECRNLRIGAEIYDEYHRIYFTLDLSGEVTLAMNRRVVARGEDQITTSVPLPADIEALKNRRLVDYLAPDSRLAPAERNTLRREQIIAANEVKSEMNSRASFGLSCLVLVMVGSLLGMRFKSGDFLTAFAVSFVPALITITLVVAGSQMATEVSYTTLKDPIVFALGLIWAGNVISAVVAGVLFYAISRT